MRSLTVYKDGFPPSNKRMELPGGGLPLIHHEIRPEVHLAAETQQSPQPKTVSDTRSIRHTSDGDPLTLLDFTSRVGAHAVVHSLMLRLNICNLEGCFQFVRGLGSEGVLFFCVVPGEDDGQSASLNGAHQRHVLPLGDVPHAGQDSQHRLGHRFCKQNSCWTKMVFICFQKLLRPSYQLCWCNAEFPSRPARAGCFWRGKPVC